MRISVIAYPHNELVLNTRQALSCRSGPVQQVVPHVIRFTFRRTSHCIGRTEVNASEQMKPDDNIPHAVHKTWPWPYSWTGFGNYTGSISTGLMRQNSKNFHGLKEKHRTASSDSRTATSGNIIAAGFRSIIAEHSKKMNNSGSLNRNAHSSTSSSTGPASCCSLTGNTAQYKCRSKTALLSAWHRYAIT